MTTEKIPPHSINDCSPDAKLVSAAVAIAGTAQAGAQERAFSRLAALAWLFVGAWIVTLYVLGGILGRTIDVLEVMRGRRE